LHTQLQLSVSCFDVIGFATLAALLLIGKVAHAQDTAPPPSADPGPGERDDRGELDNLERIDWIEEFSLKELLDVPVFAATRSTLSLSEAPARILVVTREQIERRGYRYLRDIFRDLPGYQVGQWSTGEWGTTLIVRGLSGNHRLVFLLDGQRLNPPGGEEVPLFANYPLTFVDHVEVMYGPGSALYGNDAFNGIVNIVTIPGIPREGVVANVVGGNDSTFDGALLGQFNLGPIDGRIGLHYTRTRHPNIYDLYPSDYTYPSAAGFARVDAIPSPTHDLRNFDAFESGYDGFLFLGTPDTHVTALVRGFKHASAWDRNATGAPFVPEARFSDRQFLASFSHAFTIGRLRSTTTADYSKYEVLPTTQFVTPLNLTMRTFSESARTSQSYALRLEEKVDLEIVPDVMSLTVGLAGQRVSASPFSLRRAGGISYQQYIGPGDSPAVDENNVVLDENPDLYTGVITRQSPSDIEFQTLGSYAQLLFNPSPLFHLTTGLRLDNSTRFDVSINTRVAVVSTPYPSTSIKLLYGNAYLEPTPYQVYGILTERDSLLFPNPGLQPERLHSWELVWDQRVGRYARFVTGGFVNRVVDFINDTAWTRRYVYVQRDGLQRLRELQSANAGRTLYFGGEALAQLDFGFVQSTASVSWVDGTARSLNQRGVLTETDPPNVSTLMVKGGLSVEPVRGLTLDARGIFQTAPNIRFVRSDYPMATVPGASFVLDAAVRWSLAPMLPTLPIESVAVFVTGQNLTNVRYKQPSGRPAVNPTGTPQPPLRLMAGLELAL
jgi:outer membrane cobalamin receptor